MSFQEQKSAWIQSAADNIAAADLPDLPAPIPCPIPCPTPRAISADLRPVLIVLHQETSTPGRVGNALRLLGHPLDIRRPRFGAPLPGAVDGGAGGLVVA